jgi:hypothetical protein
LLQSQTSPVSITPLPQSSETVELVVVVTDVLVVLSDGTVVDVVVPPGHAVPSISVQPLMHWRNAPVELPGQVAPPKSSPSSQPLLPQSQASPSSRTPFPQSGGVVVTVVVVVVTDDGGALELLLVDVTVVLELGPPQLLKSMVHVSSSHSRKAPSAEPGGQDAPPKSSPSHSSPSSFTSLPHSGAPSVPCA